MLVFQFAERCLRGVLKLALIGAQLGLVLRAVVPHNEWIRSLHDWRRRTT